MTELSLPRLYERDIDVLLQEELIFNPAVCGRISTALGFEIPIAVTQCALSVVDATGETDLLARFSGDEGSTGVLLIENKIDAAFQPSQPERYRARANQMATAGERAYSLLISPAGYNRARFQELAYFDARLSYEELAEAIAAQGTDRARHRAALLLRAVQQAKSSYIQMPVPEVTNMWKRIYNIASVEFSALAMGPPAEKGANSWWLIFKANLPPGITIDWKLKNGFVDLSFWDRASYKPTASSKTPPGANFLVSGKTTMFRAVIQKPPAQWVDLTDTEIRQALVKCSELLKFHDEHAPHFAA